MKILVLEDEQRAGEKLLDLIKAFQPTAMIHWERSIQDGVQFLSKNKDLDLLFSDIELLDGNVFNLFDKITPNCPIIFCTAYNAYYTDAFQTNGIAYLLKPYTESQFKAAWNKYQRLFEQSTGSSSQLNALMAQLQLNKNTDNQTFRSTFSVKKANGVFLLKTISIAYLQAKGDFVLAFDQQGNRHIINEPLAALERQLDPNLFFRINRSEILNFDCILKYEVYVKNRLAITLSKPQQILYTSNSRSPAFRDWLKR